MGHPAHANGSTQLVARAFDTSANRADSAVTVNVSNASNAVYSATYRAPLCSTAANLCDSFGLLDGRGALGPEPNAPNTISPCSDSKGGTYHVEESVDRIRVISTDGSGLAAQRTVRVEVGFWIRYTTASIALYHAADATHPQWTPVGERDINAAQYSTKSWTLTLPEGGLQAVRAVLIRAGLLDGPCPMADVRDVDDLVFAVGPAAPVCGNGLRETGEACDGSALGGQTCTSLGYGGGTLSCASSCAFNTSGCTPAVCLPAGAGTACTPTTSCCSGVGNCTGGSPSQRTCK
jgi:hypothetical protein